MAARLARNGGLRIGRLRHARPAGEAGEKGRDQHKGEERSHGAILGGRAPRASSMAGLWSHEPERPRNRRIQALSTSTAMTMATMAASSVAASWVLNTDNAT